MVLERVHLYWFHYLSVILDLVCVFAMDNALYASMDIVDCNMPCVCENASMSINSHNCDDMLHESIGVVVDIQNVKLLKKKAKNFHENFSKFTCEMMI